MIIIRSTNHVPIRLTTERWSHIIRRHPETDGQRDRVLETITNPEMIQEGDFGELIALRFYDQTPLTSKYLATIYKEVTEGDGFVITAYLRASPQRGGG